MIINHPVHLTHCHNKKNSTKRISGFLLIEAVVAILLFALGILGILGMQTSMTRSQTDSKLRSEAAYLSQEIIGLMWGDIPNIKKNFEINDNKCLSTACLHWLKKVEKTLPAGSAEISAIDLNDGSKGSTVNITITWSTPNDAKRKYITNSTIAMSHL